MKKLLMALTTMLIAIGGHAADAQEPEISAKLAREIATETYIWGYPLIVMELTRKVSVNVEDAKSLGRAPINQFYHTPTLLPAEYKDATRPNNDTLFDVAWLDLEAEPLVMSIPKTDRYHIFQMADAWQEVFAAPGTRWNGGAGGHLPDRQPRLAGRRAQRDGTPPQPYRPRLGRRPHPD